MEHIATFPPRANGVAATPAADCCANCKYFLETVMPSARDLRAPAQGVCRRRPPHPQLIGMIANPIDPKAPPQAQVIPVLPPVMGPQWCGEHGRIA